MEYERFMLETSNGKRHVRSIGYAVYLAQHVLNEPLGNGILGILTDDAVPGFRYEIQKDTVGSDVECEFRNFLLL